MNQLQDMQADLARRFPAIPTTIDAPDDDRNPWWLDICRLGLPRIVIEWRPDRGFGVSTLDPAGADVGMGPDEVYPNAGLAMKRVVDLIESGGQTQPGGN